MIFTQYREHWLHYVELLHNALFLHNAAVSNYGVKRNVYIKLSCHFEVLTPDIQGFKPTIVLECMKMNVSLCV